MLEHKKGLAEMIREHGSRVEQRYDEKPGKASARYVESVPSWFLEIDDVEQLLWDLIDAVTTVQGMLKFCQDHEPGLHEFYRLKYRDQTPLPELKKRYGGADMKKLDRDLVFNLIYWHGWMIDEDGGEDYWQWLKRR
jgi:hypothetical protein